jgi:hypothetical protein
MLSGWGGANENTFIRLHASRMAPVHGAAKEGDLAMLRVSAEPLPRNLPGALHVSAGSGASCVL